MEMNPSVNGFCEDPQGHEKVILNRKDQSHCNGGNPIVIADGV
jgi:hypothetical protein